MGEIAQGAWARVGRENAESARALGLTIDHRIRSMVSQAYYAVYAMVTQRLREAGLRNYGSRGNPPHASLHKLARNNLTKLNAVERRDLSQAIRRLRQRRVLADYDPMCVVGRDFGLEAMRDLVMTERILEFSNAN